MNTDTSDIPTGATRVDGEPSRPSPKLPDMAPRPKLDVTQSRQQATIPVRRAKKKVAPLLKVPAGTPLDTKENRPKTDEEQVFDTLIDITIEEGSDLAVELVEFMQRYVVEMDVEVAPPSGKSDEKNLRRNEIFAKRQLRFFRTILAVVEKSDPEDFVKTWIVLIAFFRRYKNGALSVRKVFRFAEYWTENKDELIAYQRIVNLLLLSTDVEQRRNVSKNVDILKTTEFCFTDAGRSNIALYYTT